jgi:hypothetical protein
VPTLVIAREKRERRTPPGASLEVVEPTSEDAERRVADLAQDWFVRHLGVRYPRSPGDA